MDILTDEQKAIATVMGNKKLQLLEKQFDGDIPTYDFDHYLLLAQAKFTYPIAVRETLKMVGEWLVEHENFNGNVDCVRISRADIEALNQSGGEK